MRGKIEVFILFVSALDYTIAGEDWKWPSYKRHDRAYHEDVESVQPESNQRATYPGVLTKRNEDERAQQYEREREPTSPRPIPGRPQNENIDDYPDSANMNDGTRNYPYAPNGQGYQLAGFNGYPGTGFGGSAANGVLVGPGGPTGFIGRPQQYYPGVANAGYPQGVAGPFNGQNGFPAQTNPGGIPGQPGGFGNGGPFPGVYPPQGQLPFEGGLHQNGGAQYPNGGQYPGVQYPGAQFPIAGQYPAGQFAGNHYPNAAAVSPYVGGQYPGGGPQFTEGYGLAYTNNHYPSNPYNAFSTGFDDYDNGKRRSHVEGKNAAVQSKISSEKSIDDKVNKNLQKS